MLREFVCTVNRIPHVHKPTLIVSTWFSTYSWIVSTPHSVPVYTSCTLTNPDSKYISLIISTDFVPPSRYIHICILVRGRIMGGSKEKVC